MKKCTKCNLEKDLTLFYTDKGFKDGKRSQCKSCDNSRRKGNIYVKRYELKSQYGISLYQYNQLLDNQENSCAICKKHKTEFSYSLCVDHNHQTGEVRGLLCKPCNLVIGNSLENIETLNKSIEYLEHYEKSK